MKKLMDYDKIQKKPTPLKCTDYEEIWRIAKKFVAVV